MLNLGPYSAKEFSNIRIRPTIVDRILEGIAALLAVVAWVCAVWVYLHVTDKVTANSSFSYAGLGTFALLVIGISAYLPIRWMHFPVRITKRNVGVQSFLAVRIVRVMNIFIALLSPVLIFKEVEVGYGIPQGLCNILIAVVSGLLVLALIVYYILAVKSK